MSQWFHLRITILNQLRKCLWMNYEDIFDHFHFCIWDINIKNHDIQQLVWKFDDSTIFSHISYKTLFGKEIITVYSRYNSVNRVIEVHFRNSGISPLIKPWRIFYPSVWFNNGLGFTGAKSNWALQVCVGPETLAGIQDFGGSWADLCTA